MLVAWAELYPALRAQPTLNLTEVLFHGEDASSFNSLEEFISYVDFVAVDVLKLLRRKGSAEDGSASSRGDELERYNFDKLGAEEIIDFLNAVLQKVLFNILLPN